MAPGRPRGGGTRHGGAGRAASRQRIPWTVRDDRLPPRRHVEVTGSPPHTMEGQRLVTFPPPAGELSRDTHTAAEVVGNHLQSRADGEVEQAMAALDPRVEWHQPGEDRLSGVHRGPEAVGALMGGTMEVSQDAFVGGPTGPLMANGDVVGTPGRPPAPARLPSARLERRTAGAVRGLLGFTSLPAKASGMSSCSPGRREPLRPPVQEAAAFSGRARCETRAIAIISSGNGGGALAVTVPSLAARPGTPSRTT